MQPWVSKETRSGVLKERRNGWDYAAFLQDAGDAVDGTKRIALGWYAVFRWDTRTRSCSPDHSHPSAHLIESRQVSQGACP